MLKYGIPRNLVGVGGIRLINLPGIKYPEHVLQAEPGMNTLTGKPYRTPPEGAISTAEAARILHRSLSSTYQFLRKNKITYYCVKSQRDFIRIYWQYSEVEELKAKLPQIEIQIPKELIQAKDVLRILNIVRSTLYRYVISGKITEIRRRVMTARGYRHQSLFIRSEVMKLKSWRSARKWQNIAWEEYKTREGTKAQREQVES